MKCCVQGQFQYLDNCVFFILSEGSAPTKAPWGHAATPPSSSKRENEIDALRGKKRRLGPGDVGEPEVKILRRAARLDAAIATVTKTLPPALFHGGVWRGKSNLLEPAAAAAAGTKQ